MTDTTPTPPLQPDILTREDGATIAYHARKGNGPGVVFLTGYMSDMTGSKALCLEALCADRGQAFLRFDYTGHGQSSGNFVDGTIGSWAADAIDAFDRLTEGPQIVVGSSMGGWIMLLLALARPERIAGLVGLAAAPDFTEDIIPAEFGPDLMAQMKRDGVVYLGSEYGPEPTPYTQALVDDGRNHLVLRRQLPLDCPVRLIHGMRDPDVPWQTSLRIAEMLRSTDVEVHLVKDGEHRLSEPEDLARLERVVGALLDGPAPASAD